MDRLLVMAALVIMLAKSGIVYPQTLIIDSVTETDAGKYVVELSTATGGIPYTLETDMDDLSRGDVMAAVMHCAGTPGDVRDDSVITMRYSGFSQQFTDDNDVILLSDNP